MSSAIRRVLDITGEVVLFAALAACATEGPHAGESCAAADGGPAPNETCNGDDEVVECVAGKWAKHVPSPTGTQCTCPDGDGTRPASCVTAGFVGVDRARPRRLS